MVVLDLVVVAGFENDGLAIMNGNYVELELDVKHNERPTTLSVEVTSDTIFALLTVPPTTPK